VDSQHDWSGKADRGGPHRSAVGEPRSAPQPEAHGARNLAIISALLVIVCVLIGLVYQVMPPGRWS
jgi:hypothetical protein